MKYLNLILVLLATIIVPDVMASTVFINEIHYDNDGADVLEGVELVGTADADLTGWSIVLYNGNNGTAYGSLDLSGVFQNQENGYGFIAVHFTSVSMQNGAPDGIALVDDANAVIQFLSYEGSFAATDGLASGLTSTDIGVSETGTTPAGYSLQLSGTGNTYEDFAWMSPAENTFGSINHGQNFSPVPIASSMWLLCSGITGLVGFRKSFKN